MFYFYWLHSLIALLYMLALCFFKVKKHSHSSLLLYLFSKISLKTLRSFSRGNIKLMDKIVMKTLKTIECFKWFQLGLTGNLKENIRYNLFTLKSFFWGFSISILFMFGLEIQLKICKFNGLNFQNQGVCARWRWNLED